MTPLPVRQGERCSSLLPDARRGGPAGVEFAGGLVDEAALLAALESGHLSGAGLDVYATEPADPGAELIRDPRVVATPHVGGLTELMFRRTGELFASSVLRWAAGEPPAWPANAPAAGRSLPSSGGVGRTAAN